MPTTKNNLNNQSTEQEKTKINQPFMLHHNLLHSHCGKKNDCGGTHFGRKLIMTFFGILLAYAIVLLGTMIRNNIYKYDYIGQAERPMRTINVQSQGKITAKPDIAVTTMGMTTEAASVAEAQKKNTEKMNTVIEKIKALGIEEKDIQTTNYNIYPKYFYPENKPREITGYEISQNITVKIRDLEKINKVITLSGEVGLNNVSGLSFTIDDKEKYLAEARAKALKNVSEKLKQLTSSLGIRAIKVVSYDEYENGEVAYGGQKEMSMYVGADAAAKEVNIQSGSMDIILNVNVNFEIR